MRISGTAVTKVVQSCVSLPNGDFDARITGYNVEFKHEGITYEISTTYGVRGFNVPAVVSIENNRIIEIIIT